MCFFLGAYGAPEHEKSELIPSLLYSMTFSDFYPDATGAINITFALLDAPLLSLVIITLMIILLLKFL